jgi:hypothetical protein
MLLDKMTGAHTAAGFPIGKLMSAASAKLIPQPKWCLVDQQPAEHDCKRVTVDFAVRLQLRDLNYPMRAVQMCGAGITLSGQVPAAINDNVQLTIAFPGRRHPLLATGRVVRVTGAELGCEYWATNSYEQQFLDAFVQACARRQELRKSGPCDHPSEVAAASR